MSIFRIEGDLIGFFITINNTLDSQITKVAVRLQVPPSIKLDYNTPSKTIRIGEIDAQKSGEVQFYISQIGKEETIINATVEYKEMSGSYQITRIEPFKISSSRNIITHTMSTEGFNKTFEKRNLYGQPIALTIKKAINVRRNIRIYFIFCIYLRSPTSCC